MRGATIWPALALAAAAFLGTAVAAAPPASEGGASAPRTARATESTPKRTQAAPTASADADGVHAQLTLTAPHGWQPGVPIQAVVQLTLPAGARAEPPAIGTSLGQWDLRDERLDTGSAPASQALRFTLTAWEAGTLIVPAVPVTVLLADGKRVQLAVGPVDVTLDSLLAEGLDLTELAAPIRGPVDIRTNRWLWLVLATVGAALSLWLARWLFLRSRTPETQPPLPPDAWALRELDRLESEHLPARGEIDGFFARLSDIVRHYVEQRWGVSAPEQTTKEFLRSAQQHPELAGGHERTLGQFLRNADMVKFAAVRPGDPDCTNALGAMRTFVRQSAPPAVGEQPEAKS